MSLLEQLFKKKQQHPERLQRVVRAVELLISEQEYVKIPRDKGLDYDYVHMKEAVKYGRILAEKRKMDADVACIACALQNVGRIKFGETSGHSESGDAVARQMLIDLGSFSPAEIEQIAGAVRNHSKKDKVHRPLDELVKDADIYTRYVRGYAFTRQEDIRRLNALKLELHV